MIFNKAGHKHGVSKRVQILAILSIVGWSCLIGALILFHYGRPELEYGILNYFGFTVRKVWLVEFKFWYFVLLTCCCLTSLLSMFVNRNRVKHHRHRVRYNTVLLLLIAFAMMLPAIGS